MNCNDVMIVAPWMEQAVKAVRDVQLTDLFPTLRRSPTLDETIRTTLANAIDRQIMDVLKHG